MTTQTPETEMESGRGAIAFPAGNDDFRAVRNSCARACRIFNETPEDADPEIRCRNWLDIVQPRRTDITTSPAITLSETFRDPTLRPAVPFVKPPLHMDYGLRVRVGSTTFINRHCMIMDTPVADVTIGERCNIGPHCSILSVGHPLGCVERTENRRSTGRPVRVGDGVWIGAGVTIMGGVTIGDGAVIGACSLVTHDIPPRTLAFGVPAVVHRELKDHEDADDTAGYVETLEEALKLTSDDDESTAPSLDSMSKSGPAITSANVDHRPCPLNGPRNGVRESRMTRAEVLSIVALAMSFLSSFLVVALVVVAKRMVC